MVKRSLFQALGSWGQVEIDGEQQKQQVFHHIFSRSSLTTESFGNWQGEEKSYCFSLSCVPECLIILSNFTVISFVLKCSE